MWRYCGATFFILIGALELILALNKRMRDEIMKNAPVQPKRGLPLHLARDTGEGVTLEQALAGPHPSEADRRRRPMS